MRPTTLEMVFQHDSEAPEISLPIIWGDRADDMGGGRTRGQTGYTIEEEGHNWPVLESLGTFFSYGVCRVDTRVGGWVELRDTTPDTKHPVRYAHPRPRAKEAGAEWVMGLQPR